MDVEVSVETWTGGSSSTTIDLPSDETWQTWFCCWLEALNPQLSPIDSYELGLRLTSDQDIQALNHQYRHLDYPTDVLAFATLDEAYVHIPEEMLISTPLYLGDIVISVETAQCQAVQQGHSLLVEMGWLASHGLLHLLGWDHPDERSLAEMLYQQRQLLRQVGVLSPSA
jgi:probable rRNA maturation factor